MTEQPTKGAWALGRVRREGRKLTRQLSEVASRTYLVGSVRRGRDPVGDLEMLVEPKDKGQADLFGAAGTADEAATDVTRVAAVVRGWGEWVKGGDRMMQVRRRMEVGEYLQVDVFVVHPPAEWGTLMAIRTGPAELGQRAVTRIRARGWRCADGAVWRPAETGPDGEPPLGVVTREMEGRLWRKVPTPTEREFFDAAMLETVPPGRRDGMVPAKAEPDS